MKHSHGLAIPTTLQDVCDPQRMALLVYGGRRVADAEAGGELMLTGDRRLFDRFLTWFPLPEKIG